MEWNLKLEEAIMHSGLEMGNVAKTYLYFPAPAEAHRRHHAPAAWTLGRFEEARLLALRLAQRQGDQTSYYDITNEDEVTQSKNYWNQDDNSWNHEADWTSGDWNDEWLESYYDEDLDWFEANYDDSWYTDEGIYQDTANQDNRTTATRVRRLLEGQAQRPHGLGLQDLRIEMAFCCILPSATIWWP